MTGFKSLLISTLLLLFFAVLRPELVFSQENKLDRIELKWSLYRQLNNSNRPYIAYTAHQTIHKYRATQHGNRLVLKFTVGVGLDRKASTVDPQRLSALDPEEQKRLLHHEQGHSDLAVIYGRILYKNLSKGVYGINGFKQEVKRIYDRTMQQLAAMQARYDIETAHGEEQELQDKWDSYFKKELKN